MTYSKKDLEILSWIVPMDTKEHTVKELAEKMRYSNLEKLEQFLKEYKLKYKEEKKE